MGVVEKFLLQRSKVKKTSAKQHLPVAKAIQGKSPQEIYQQNKQKKSVEVTKQVAKKNDYPIWEKMVITDFHALKAIEDHAKRDALKPSFIKKYKEHLVEFMSEGLEHANHVLYLNIVWSLDVGDFKWALILVDYAYEIGQPVIDIKNGEYSYFKSLPATIFTDFVVKYSRKHFEELDDFPDVFKELIIRLNENWTVNPISKAKAYRLMGEHHSLKLELLKAQDYFKKALDLDPNVGAKNLLKKVEQALAQQ